MAKIVYDDGTLVLKIPSTASPGDTQVTITGPTFDAVQRAIFDLGDDYPQAHFTLPARCADGGWGATGRVR